MFWSPRRPFSTWRNQNASPRQIQPQLVGASAFFSCYFSLEETTDRRDTLTPKNLMTAAHPSALLTPEVAVVGRHHQQLGVGVLDDVPPVDGVGVAQELVLVDVNSPVQDLCVERKNKRTGSRGGG